MIARLMIFSLITLQAQSAMPEYISWKSIETTKININKTLDSLEDAMIDEDEEGACRASKKAALSITKNINQLGKLEPNYNWHEIRDVLKKLTTRYCR